MTEQEIIERLRDYKRVVSRIKMLERYSIGNGMYLEALKDDDKLQALHRQLRGLPSYVYLNKHEQELESVAHAYLMRYPVGTRAQLNEVRHLSGADPDDEMRLRELQRKIQKVIEARTGAVDGYEAVIERISELQDLEEQKKQIDNALEALEDYKPKYAKLLRLRYLEGLNAEETGKEWGVTRKTIDRWTKAAFSELAYLTGGGKNVL